MEILVTGGNGFLGRHLIRALQKRADGVRVLALPTEDTRWLDEHGVPVFRGDILEPTTLATPMRDVTCVIHLAAMLGTWASPRDYAAVNVKGTANVCDAALAAGVARLVHVSSAMVYGMAGNRPATEEDSLAPLNEPYCVTKAQGDLLVQRLIREQHLPAVIIRPGTLIGPRDRLNFGRMADRVRTGKAVIIGRGDNAIPLFSVSDMVRALLTVADSEHAVGRIYNIGADQPITQARYLALISGQLGVPTPRLHVPYRALYAAAYLAERVAAWSDGRLPPPVTRHGVKLYGANNVISTDKARSELGFRSEVPLVEAVRAACEWYLDDGHSIARGQRQPSEVLEGSAVAGGV
jgi:nucleoside-diphosphate-sugar epimerase